MIRTLALGLALVAAGCGGRPTPVAPEPVAPDAGVDAAPDAPPGDPAMREVLDALRAFRDRGCACATAACGEEIEVAQVQWGFEHKELLDRARPDPAQQAEARALVEATEACLERWH